MNDAHGLYLGWSQPGHHPDCPRRVWEVDTRTNHDARRGRHEGAEHRCPNEDCSHDDQYSELTVRVICRGCTAVHVYVGEETARSGGSTRQLGYGQRPRKVGGLWLHPGAPLLYDDEVPWDFLCALDRVDRLEREHIVGYIRQARGRLGALKWSAAAVPELGDTGRASGRPLTYRVRSGDGMFKTPTAAAKWVREQVDAAQSAEAGTEGFVAR